MCDYFLTVKQVLSLVATDIMNFRVL